MTLDDKEEAGLQAFVPGFYWWVCPGGELPLGLCACQDDVDRALLDFMQFASEGEDFSGWSVVGPAPAVA